MKTVVRQFDLFFIRYLNLEVCMLRNCLNWLQIDENIYKLYKCYYKIILFLKTDN